LLTVATADAELLQVTVVVRSFVVWSVNTPVAANCCFTPAATLGTAGVTPIEARVAAVTVRAALAVIVLPGTEAAIVLVPTVRVVASPFVPAALLIVATVAADVLQVTVFVRSAFELSV
jgi:hypothetical protein